MNPYELHAQNQFHAPLSETNRGVEFTLNITTTNDPYILTSRTVQQEVMDIIDGEPHIVISESSARAIVAAIDNNRPHKAALLIKDLPWFNRILSGVRATRHLDPADYLRLSGS